VPGKCNRVIVVNWAEIGRSMTDRKFRVQSSLFRSLWTSIRPSLGTFHGPRPASRCGNTFAFATAICYLAIKCNCSACSVPPDAGLQKRGNFSTLIVGLAETGEPAWATSVSGSGENCSAIHYDLFTRYNLSKRVGSEQNLILHAWYRVKLQVL
jgi:hypothetical protein